MAIKLAGALFIVGLLAFHKGERGIGVFCFAAGLAALATVN